MPDDEHDESAELEPSDEPTIRPFWSGTLSFGLVSIPVSLFPASRRSGISLRMLAPDGTPLARRYYCSEEDVPVDGDHLVRGFELEDGSYVVVSDEELEAVDPRKSRDIDLRLFVPAAAIDPIYFERTYVLTSGSESTKAYRLLAEVMERQKRAGIATFVMRENEYVIAIFAERGVLHAQTLRFADEVRDAEETGAPRDAKPDRALVQAFVRAIQKHAGKFDPNELKDVQTETLRKHFEQKRKRGEGVIEGAEVGPAPHAEIIDLMEVLKRNLRAASEPAGDKRAKRTERTERAEPSRSRRTPSPSPTPNPSPRARSRGPDRPARTGPSAEELEQLSREELYERAKALDVPGRSQMSKPQLVRAVRKKTGSTR